MIGIYVICAALFLLSMFLLYKVIVLEILNDGLEHYAKEMFIIVFSEIGIDADQCFPEREKR